MESFSYSFFFTRLSFTLPILHLFLIIFIFAFCFPKPLCRNDERTALLQLKSSFIIDESASTDPSSYIPSFLHGQYTAIVLIVARGMALNAIRTRVMWRRLISIAVVCTVLSTPPAAFFGFLNCEASTLLIIISTTLISRLSRAVFQG